MKYYILKINEYKQEAKEENTISQIKLHGDL